MAGILSKIADEVGMSKSTVWGSLKLLQQPKYVIEDLIKGKAKTLYTETESLPLDIRNRVKKGISEGKIKSRPDIRRLRKIIIVKPEQAEIELNRMFKKQSSDANKILDKALELQIVLKEATPEKWTDIDVSAVRSQLGSVMGVARSFASGSVDTILEIEE